MDFLHLVTHHCQLSSLHHSDWGHKVVLVVVGWTKDVFSWPDYLTHTGSAAAAADAFRKVISKLFIFKIYLFNVPLKTMFTHKTP